jgi:hypothetical protein
MKFVVIARPRPPQQGMTSAMVHATLEKVNRQLKIGIIRLHLEVLHIAVARWQ